MEFVHQHCEVIHTDIKASNYLLYAPYQKIRAFYDDLYEKKRSREEETIESYKKENHLWKIIDELKEQEKKNLGKKERKKLKQKIKKNE